MEKHNIFHKLAAVATMGVMMGSSADAFAAAGTFNQLTKNIVDSTSNLTSLISTTCYIGGAGLGVAGIFKLKNHVDNPTQHPMKDGLVRLGAGGGLLAFPFMQSAMQNAIGGGSNASVDINKVKIDGNLSTFTQ